MEIRDLEYQHASLELVNDVTAESIIGGNGSTIILSTTGTLLVFNTGPNTIQTSNQSFASIAGTFPSLTVNGGTLIQTFIRPV